MADAPVDFKPYARSARLLDAITLGFIALSGLLIDTLLPTARLETEVHPMTYLHAGHRVDYAIPGSGGEIGHCTIDEASFLDLAPLDAIIVERTALLDRCLRVKPRHAAAR